jgi:hypothetical protein
LAGSLPAPTTFRLAAATGMAEHSDLRSPTLHASSRIATSEGTLPFLRGANASACNQRDASADLLEHLAPSQRLSAFCALSDLCRGEMNFELSAVDWKANNNPRL